MCGGERREGGGVQGNGHSGLGGPATLVGGEEEGPECSHALVGLKGEQSVQYLGVPSHPILKLLHKKNATCTCTYTHLRQLRC